MRLYSPTFGEGVFSEGGRLSLGAYQAPYHPYHKLYGPSILQVLLAHQRAPRLQVQGKGYSPAKCLTAIAACPEGVREGVPHRLERIGA
jgi:hypothetical protein